MAKLFTRAVELVLTVIVILRFSKAMDKQVYALCLKQDNQDEDIAFLRREVNKSPTLLLQRTKRMETLLHLSACHGNVNFVDAILDLHKHCPVWWIRWWPLVKATNYHGNSVLHEAATAGHTNVVKYLVSLYPFLVDEVNWCGETGLFLACENGHEDVVDEILTHARQVDLGHTRKDGETCFHIAAYRGYTGVLRLLLEKEGEEGGKGGCEYLDKKDETGATALHCAVEGGNAEAVKYVLQSKPDLCDELDREGRCPIHVAAMKGDYDSIDIMLDENTDYAGNVSSDGKTILHYAAEYNDGHIVDLIWQRRSLCRLYGDECDKDGNQPLHLAMKNNADKAMLETLLSQFPRVN